MADITILDSDPAPSATISFEDAADFPTTATPDAPPIWAESSSGTVVTVVSAADGMSATFPPVAPGTSTVTVSLSISGEALVGTGTIEVTGGAVSKIAITFSPGVAPAPPAPVDPAAPTA